MLEPLQCFFQALGASMRRREFLGVLGGAATSPLAAHAQRSEMPLVGFFERAIT
jgi:hypothetical protein